MNLKAYGQYDIEDFLLDDFFVQWVLRPDLQNSRFWQQWLDSYPEKREALMQARELLLSIHFDEEKMSVWQLEENWQQLETNYKQPANKRNIIWGKTKIFSTRPTTVKWIGALAATVVLLICAAYLLFSVQTFQTGYGQVKNLRLSDGTEVTLAPHSSLSVDRFLSFGKRKAQLKGEAFFKVKHIADPDRAFLVRSGDLRIRVLGTEFSVNNYSGNSEVVLKNGKVALYPDKKVQPVYMRPGEKAIYNPEKLSLQKEQIDLEEYAVWLKKDWHLNRVRLSDIIDNIQYRYGLKLHLSDPSLATKTITASIADVSPKKIFTVLETVFQAQIDTLGEHIYLMRIPTK